MTPLLIAFGAVFAVVAQPPSAKRTTHDCHVYAVDIAGARKLLEEMAARPEAKPEDLRNAAQKVEKILGQFKAEVGEEVATTKSYPLPGTEWAVTATVYYTDESMELSVSMLQGLAIAKGPVEDVLNHPGASITEVNLEKDTYKVRTKQQASIQGKPWIVGLECQCMAREQREKDLGNGRK